MTLLLLLAGSCEKNESLLDIAETSEIQALSVADQIQSSEIQTAIANGEDFKIAYPPNSEIKNAGCRCFMRVVGVENTPGDPNVSQVWGINGVTAPSIDFSGRFSGSQAVWNQQVPIAQFSLPTPFEEINPLSSSTPATFGGVYSHMFYMIGDLPFAPGYQISTEVTCYGTDRIGNFTTSHTLPYVFDWEDGGPITSHVVAFRAFFTDFSCHDIAAPKPRRPR